MTILHYPFRFFPIFIALSLLIASVINTVPVAAHHLSGGDDLVEISPEDDQISEPAAVPLQQSVSGVAQTSTPTSSAQARTRPILSAAMLAYIRDLQGQARQQLEGRRTKHASKSVTESQKACTARKSLLKGKLATYNADIKTALARYDATLTKLQDYQAANRITSAEYDGRVTAAKAKQAAAGEAVLAVGLLTDDMDCTEDDPAAAAQTVKLAVTAAKAALAGYQKSLQAVTLALLRAGG